MKTKKTYLVDKYLSKIQTNITEVKKEKGHILIATEETVFFPGGGGQSCDLGTINGHQVSNVFETEDEIYHRIENPEDLSLDDLAVGAPCQMEIDWERRFDNMQRHCGEHILSGICYDLWGGVNRGFHMGDDYMTIDISLEDKPEFKEVTRDMAMEAELKANEVIWKDLPVKTHFFDSRQEAEKMPLRKALAIESDITIVTIGDEDKPADSVACCGTHPSTAGQVGLIKVYKVEPNKGMFRIYFEAGKRALEGYRERFDILSTLEKDLSAGTPDLLEKYRSRQEKNKEVRDRLFHLTKEVKAREQERIVSEMEKDSAEGRSCSIFRYDILSLDDLIDMGRGLEGKVPGILFLIHNPSLTILMFSDKNDCGKLVKDNVDIFAGKGGGNSKFARAIFKRPEDGEMFIDAVEKLLR